MSTPFVPICSNAVVAVNVASVIVLALAVLALPVHSAPRSDVTCVSIVQDTLRTGKYAGIKLGDSLQKVKTAIRYRAGDERFVWTGHSDFLVHTPQPKSHTAATFVLENAGFEFDRTDHVSRIFVSMRCTKADSTTIVALLNKPNTPLRVRFGGRLRQVQLLPDLSPTEKDTVIGIRLQAQ